ncbi:MAG: hypothetical protein HWE13_02680 [Gammaproteobacteria bacterium]|nr:hypothetical protein [Gammaproteobacteria bacterium]
MAIANDKYEKFLSEKLWQWIPAVYREQDGLVGGHSLKAFIEVIAKQAALQKRSQDRLWDDTAIELASDWAVPYLGELLATRLVSSLNPRGRRVDVAKTVYYRRRKGTLLVQEQLVSDIAGWDSKVVEEFNRLARAWHLLDCPIQQGLLTQTPSAGFADFRATRGRDIVGGPFDEYYRIPSQRAVDGRLGRQQINVLSYYLYRLNSVRYVAVQPRHFATLPDGREQMTCDPSGRDIQLFSGNTVAKDWADWRSAKEWELPKPISCQLLSEEIFSPSAEAVAWLMTDAPIALPADREAAVNDFSLLVGQRFNHRQALLRVLSGLSAAATLTSPGIQTELLARSLIRDCGSAALLPNGSDVQPWSSEGDPEDGSYGTPAIRVGFITESDPIARPRTRAAKLRDWAPPLLPNVDLTISPADGRMVLEADGHALRTVMVNYQVGMMAPIGAGAYSRVTDFPAADAVWQNSSVAAGTPANGVAAVLDSHTYASPQNQLAVINTQVYAAADERPYFVLNNHWRLSAGEDDAQLLLDGLWLGCRNPRNVILDGNFETVTIRHCTFDPGGLATDGSVLPPVNLIIAGYVERLVIEQSVMASIRLQSTDARVEYLIVNDSIIQGRDGVTIDLLSAQVELQGTTVMTLSDGELLIDCERLYASDSLCAGVVDVTDNQNGCFRFSAAQTGSQVAKPYRSIFRNDFSGVFQSTRFADYQFANITPRLFPEMAQGAEEGLEMGAFNQMINPIKQRSAQLKVNEYLPFGRMPNFIIEM